MEILQTGDLRRINYEKTDDVRVTRLFQGIYGVGEYHLSASFSINAARSFSKANQLRLSGIARGVVLWKISATKKVACA